MSFQEFSRVVEMNKMNLYLKANFIELSAVLVNGLVVVTRLMNQSMSIHEPKA